MAADSFFPWYTSICGVLHGAVLARHCHWFRKQLPLTGVCYRYNSSLWREPIPGLCDIKSPSDVKFCRAVLANGHMESIFNSKYPHFGVVAFSSISFHHSKVLIKNLLLQQGRLIQFRFYLLKNNHLSATEKEEKNLSLKIWRSVSL